MTILKKVYVDWAVKNPHTVYINKKVQKMSNKELLQLAPANFYMETGCPYIILHKLLAKGSKIYQISGEKIKEVRSKTNQKKTDKLDAVIIRAYAMNSPKEFIELTQKGKDEVKLKFLMAQYRHFMKDCVRMKNCNKAYIKEFAECNKLYETMIHELELAKREIVNKIRPLIKEETEVLQHIKGLGPRLLAGLMAEADPKRFNSKSAYLAYCGCKDFTYYKDPSKGYVKGNLRGYYNHRAKTLLWQITKEVIMHKDSIYYPLYLKIKNDLKKRNVLLSKIAINNKAINRIQTFIAKEVYTLLRKSGKDKSQKFLKSAHIVNYLSTPQKEVI